ncbi:thioredoxin fold domain-containing protein [Aliifodinibius sp. S!AR15-10]|uniref:thioredoxin family protein n=1 Tax=Aliifodinibius sp. S!AR15-10 TaxID=2950437 RepID=UPI00285FF675|nr:thioredoxin fold domain-containing protein [Aliifodinibius sp. S!AR15-10]MDR8391188.1 thioredoxin fold domain-containing protein [Aliifodinibius sp. S!AR15-10]
MKVKIDKLGNELRYIQNDMKQVAILLSFFLFLFGSGFDHSDGIQEKAGITWYSLKEAQQLANTSDKKVFIYMEASWCGYCKKMENEVFPVKEVQDAMQEYFYPVRMDIESDKEITFNGTQMTKKEFASSIRVTGTPTHLFLDGKGEILGKQPGFIPADVFKSLLSYVGSDAFGQIKFEQYLNESKK